MTICWEVVSQTKTEQVQGGKRRMRLSEVPRFQVTVPSKALRAWSLALYVWIFFICVFREATFPTMKSFCIIAQVDSS